MNRERATTLCEGARSILDEIAHRELASDADGAREHILDTIGHGCRAIGYADRATIIIDNTDAIGGTVGREFAPLYHIQAISDGRIIKWCL